MINALLTGPIFDIINKLIPDPDLKQKLKAEVEKSVQNTQTQITHAQRDVIVQEYKHDGILTRNWRPILMILAGFIIAFYGLILPTIQLFTDQKIQFQPMWNQVPDQIWEILKWGIAGYIGGRSLEKISKNATQINRNKNTKQNTQQQKITKPPK